MSGVSDITRKSVANVAATLQRAQQGGSLHELALDAVVVVSNVRGEIDETAPDFLEFVENIRTHGVQQPILVRPSKKTQGKYELIAGERRWRGSRVAGKQRIPAIVKHISDAEFLNIQLLENYQRENLTMLQEAAALKRMLDEVGSLERVAEMWQQATNKRSVSKSWVSERLQLLDLSEPARELIEENVTSDIGVINSVNRAAKIDPEAGKELAAEVRASDKKREVARRGLEEVKGRAPAKPASKTAKRVPADWNKEAVKLAGRLAAVTKPNTPKTEAKRVVKEAIGEVDKRAAEALNVPLKAAHAAGTKLAKGWQSGLAASTAMLAEQLDGDAGRQETMRTLLLKAFALGAMKQPYDLATIVVS